MVVGSCAYCAQLGVGTAEPIPSSWVSAVASPGAPSAAEYSAVGGRLRKSPTPPRRMPRGNARPPPSSPGFGGEGPREADSWRSVHLTRDAVGADAEQRIE